MKCEVELEVVSSYYLTEEIVFSTWYVNSYYCHLASFSPQRILTHAQVTAGYPFSSPSPLRTWVRGYVGSAQHLASLSLTSISIMSS